MMASDLRNRLRNKNVVFITVKNKDYIRVTQIERLLKQEALSYTVYSSEKPNPLSRAIELNRRIKKIDFTETNVIILGFLPQLIYKSVEKKLDRAIREKRRVRKPVIIADFFLSLYDTICLDRKLVSPKGLIAKKLHDMDTAALQGADKVITDTKADAEFFAEEFGVDVSKFGVLYLEADETIFSNSDKLHEMKENFKNVINDRMQPHLQEEDASKESAGSTREVLYFGTGLPLQGTAVVLEAFEEVAKEGIKCTYIGGTKGVPKTLLQRLKQSDNLELIRWLSQEELSKRIEGASLCIAGHFNPNIDKADRTIPGKAYIYEAMNKKMILGDTKANNELFSPNEQHIFVPRGDSRALAEAIKTGLYT